MFGLSQGILVTSFFTRCRVSQNFCWCFCELIHTFRIKTWPTLCLTSHGKSNPHGGQTSTILLIPFPLLRCIKTVFPVMQKTRSNFEVAYLCFNRILENLSNFLFQNFQSKYDPSTYMVHKSANFTVHIFLYCFTGFTPLVGFLDVICSSVGFAYHVNGSWFQ